jgi:hypothetical protein
MANTNLITRCEKRGKNEKSERDDTTLFDQAEVFILLSIAGTM